MLKERDDWFVRLRNLAEQMVGKGAKELPELHTEALDRLINEIQVYQTELEIQNEELRKTQTELEASRIRFSRLRRYVSR